MPIQPNQFTPTQIPRVDYETHGQIAQALDSGTRTGWQIGSDIRSKLDEVQKTVEDRNNRNEAKQLVEAWNQEDNAEAQTKRDANGEQMMNPDGSPMMTSPGINTQQAQLNERFQKAQMLHNSGQMSNEDFAKEVASIEPQGLALHQKKMETNLQRIAANVGNTYVQDALKPAVVGSMKTLQAYSDNMNRVHQDLADKLALADKHAAAQDKQHHDDQQKALDRASAERVAGIKSRSKTAQTPEEKENSVFGQIVGQATSDIGTEGEPGAIQKRVDEIGQARFGTKWAQIKSRNAPEAPAQANQQDEQPPEDLDPETQQLYEKYQEGKSHRDALLENDADLRSELDRMPPEAMASSEGSEKWKKLKEQIAANQEQVKKLNEYLKKLEDQKSKYDGAKNNAVKGKRLQEAADFINTLDQK